MQTISTRRVSGRAGRLRRTTLALLLIVAPALLLVAGCDLDLTNPNSPTQEATVTSAEGLMALGVGLQARASDAIGNHVYTAGLVTDEAAATINALINIRDAEVGTVSPGAGLVSDPWNSNYRTIKTANDIIQNAYGIENLSPGTRSGLVSMAYLFKAGSILNLVQEFRQVSIQTLGTETPTFVDRATALAAAIELLDSAATTYADTAPSAQFNSAVRSTSFDLQNTIFAYQARAYWLAADYPSAVTAANKVSRTVFSRFTHTATALNRLFNLSTTGSSGALPRDAVRLTAPAEYAATVTYHITPSTAVAGFNQPVDAYANFSTAASPMPLYYPDEPLLIKAEALARQNQLAPAQAALDSVRTDCPGLVATDPNACMTALPAGLTQAQLLTEIYTMRRYELFATGLRWEDARRLGLVGAGSVAKRCWLPYSIGERNANPGNVPADPEGIDAPAFPANCSTT